MMSKVLEKNAIKHNLVGHFYDQRCTGLQRVATVTVAQGNKTTSTEVHSIGFGGQEGMHRARINPPAP